MKSNKISTSVLLAGHINYSLFSPFSRLLRRNNIRTSVAGLKRPGTSIDGYDLSMFEKVYDTKLSLSWKELLNLLRPQNTVKTVSDSVSYPRLIRNNPKKLLSNVLRHYCFKNIVSNHNIIHVNYLNWPAAKIIEACNKQQVIVTFLGGDLLGKAGITSYKMQKRAIEKADIITVPHYFMREVFLSKFGREYINKTKVAKFGLTPNKTKILDKVRNGKSQRDFEINFSIPKDKLKIQVGYNADYDQGHLETIKSIENSKINNDKIHLLLPMTYSRNCKKYLKNVENLVEGTSITSTVFNEFLCEKEISAVHSTTDVFIMVKRSDAMNNALNEHLYLGNQVIAGSWLPYDIYKRSGSTIYYVDSRKEVGDCLSGVMSVAGKGNTLPEFAYMENAIDDWLTVYDKAAK